MRKLIGLVVLLAGAAAAATPVIFVHGNGDDATKWVPTIWLFESNGYPADRLFAIRLTDPVARREDSKPEEFRSSTVDQASELSAFVTRVLLATKVPKVALVGSSRGGMTIRNYVRNAGGAAVVSEAILCGTPNHGVFAMDTGLDGEFNGKGTFLRQLNEGSEVVPGVRFLTLRSDKLDKYAQPNVGFDGPELKGAKNVVLPGLDHREVAFHPSAFAEMYEFLTGEKPAKTQPTAEAKPVLSGLVTGFASAAPTNRPLAGVRFRAFALRSGSAEREASPAFEVVTGESGAWGPLTVEPDRHYEFVLERDGRSVSYFMAPIPRSTKLLNFRFVSGAAAQLLSASTEAGPRLLVHRPQGYLAQGRDPVTMDGVAVEGIADGIPTRDSVLVKVADSKAGVRVELRGETILARPAKDPQELSIAELLWD